MGITANFLKLRSTGIPKTGEWNKDYGKALELAKKNGKYIVTCWSNGDACSYCTAAETCMMDKVFTDWMKTADAYFVFQYSGDSDKGKTLHDWIFNGTGVKTYPGYRITLYDAKGKVVKNKAIDGNTLRARKIKSYGATEMVTNLKTILADKPASSGGSTTPAKPTETTQKYKVRFNEKLTVKKVNTILDSIDKNNGYCPCQVKSAKTKCHCEDFVNNKKIGEPCICKIYVKQKA